MSPKVHRFAKFLGVNFFLGESYFLTDPEGLSNFFEKWSKFKNLSKTIINYNFDHFSRKENVKICLFVRNLTEILDEFVMEGHIFACHFIDQLTNS